jgi:dihydroflavonol-4-reductase
MNSEINGERFIVSGVNLSYKDLFIKISNAFGKKPPKKLATKFMTSIAWRADFIRSIITGSSPMITRETSASAHKIQNYSSLKLTDKTGFAFTGIDDTINEIVHYYLDQLKEKKH